MILAKEIFKKALDNKLITGKEWNEGFYVFIVCHIVWETKYHDIIHVLHDEEQAKEFCRTRGLSEYFYKSVKVN